MFICICHAITDSDVRQAMDEGEMSLVGIYKRLGCRPRCGKCVESMTDLIAVESERRAGDARD